MYKYYNKDDYHVMHYYFDSITEYLNYVKDAPISNAFQNTSLDSEASGEYSWYKTHNLEEAKDMAKYGYHEDFDKFMELKFELEKYIKISQKKSKQYNFYVGYAPDVKAYLEGCPLNMLNKENPPRKQVDIYYNAAILGDVDANQIFNRGVVTLSIVEILEKLGYSVNLNIFSMSEDGSQIHHAVFRLKDTTERVNAQKLFFPMCHPSFHRRLVFKLREVTPDITTSWTWGYGKTCSENTIRKIIDLNKNDIVICRPDEMNVHGNDLIEDANSMFEYINNENNEKDFELPHLQKVKTLY